MTDPKFRPGDIVYHKATLKRGVISAKAGGTGGEGWMVAWADDGRARETGEPELYTEEEFATEHGEP